MKRLLALIPLTLCLAGCGVSTEDAPSPITTPVPTVTPTLSSRPATTTPCPSPGSSASRQVHPTAEPAGWRGKPPTPEEP